MKRTLFVFVHLMGLTVAHAQGYFDCYDVWNGPNLPNTTCVTTAGAEGTWNANCACIANADAFDCNGMFNGGAFPGTMCQWTNDSLTYRMGIWSPNCTCDLDSNYIAKDCPGVTGGHSWPGTPCVLPGSAEVGVWSPRCICEVAPPVPCHADFWVVQAHRADSIPVPYVLWIWDLSRHGADAHAYHWDFGDGAASQEKYPTHKYKDSGPYELCLTIDNGKGCTSRNCHSVSVDNDGFFNGLVAVTDHGVGFTVIVPCLKGMVLDDLRVFDGLSITSGPGSDDVEVELMSKSDRPVVVSIVGADGRSIFSNRRRLVVGKNAWRIPVGSLGSGTYLLRITEGTKTIAQRLIRIR